MDGVDSRLSAIVTSLYRVAVRAIIVKDDALLMVCEEGDDYYTTPGGGLDYGEEPHRALIRELYEELGLAEDEFEVGDKPVLVGTSLKEGIPRVHIYYQVELTSGVPKVGKEADDIQWCSLTEVITNHGQPRLMGNLENLSQVMDIVHSSQR